MVNIDVDFFDDFKCKADRCHHTCCMGWEIDIDSKTYEFYKKLDTDFGREIMQNIETVPDESSDENIEGKKIHRFKLTEDERCPFLNENGLCKIIENIGEDCLCEICSEHPRFYQNIGEYSLAGIGLSCERVCEIIDEKEDLNFLVYDTEFKKIDFTKLLELLNIKSDFKEKDFFNFDNKEVINFFDILFNTEPIDENWREEVLKVKEYFEKKPDITKNINVNYQFYINIYKYLVYRQLEKIKVYSIDKIEKFAKLNVIYIVVRTMINSDYLDNTRRWSEQIEYNEDNINMIYERI